MSAKRKDVLDQFGKQVVEDVYDRALKQVQLIISGKMRGKYSTELYEA